MTVSINFPAEIEAVLRRRVATAGKDVETFVKEAVRDRLAGESPPPTKLTSHAEFMAKLHEIIKLHPISNGAVDDSRDSICAGRGE